MEHRRLRSGAAGGVLLILLGLAFLVVQLFPRQFEFLQAEFGAPLIMMVIGLFLLVFGIVVGAPGMAIPASIVAGIGGILYFQGLTGDYGSWAYMWTLIPGFVGVGVLLNGALGGEPMRKAIDGGGSLILTSMIMFAIFGSFMGGFTNLGPYWPALLIAAGLLILLRSFFRR